MKAIIFDSSSIITLALNNLLHILSDLKKEFKGKFLITDLIKKEIIDKPLKIKKFELEALFISKLLKKGILEISPEKIQRETKRICNYSNRTYKADNEFIKIVHEGEASCLALYEVLKQKGGEVVLVIDERTTRMLCESPLNLKKLFEKKLHTKIKMDEGNLRYFKGFDIIRSSELCLVAFNKGFIQLPTSPQKAVNALLYALKYKGCSISREEIEQVKQSKLI